MFIDPITLTIIIPHLPKRKHKKDALPLTIKHICTYTLNIQTKVKLSK